MHRFGDVEMWSNFERFDTRCQIDVREDDAAEDCSMRVGVLRHHHDLYRRHAVAHPVSISVDAAALQEICGAADKHDQIERKAFIIKAQMSTLTNGRAAAPSLPPSTSSTTAWTVQ